MASAVIAGVMAYSATGITAYAMGAALVAGAAGVFMQQAMQPDMPDQQMVQLGSSASAIDKTALQKQAEQGKLELGESAEEKAKRKRGKAAFKIALQEKERQAAQGLAPTTGVQAPKIKEVGVQL